MEYIKNTTKFQIPAHSAISLGKFDGIHKGHEALLDFLKKKKQEGFLTVIFTFDIPPKKNMDGTIHEKVLTTNEEKMHIFENYGIDYLIECPFTAEIMHMEAEDFIRMLVNDLKIKSIVVGTDFHFGHNRRGDYRMLQEYADVYEYTVEVVQKVQKYGRDISSTFIREEIADGNIEKANELLGYSYFIEGTVVYGNQIGRTLNIPTLNLLPGENKLLPPFGVYITRTIYQGVSYEGITNVGRKPTIAGIHPVGIETHLLDFDQNIYGEFIRVDFLKRLRDEVKFSSLDQLKDQMQQDIWQARKYYADVTDVC